VSHVALASLRGPERKGEYGVPAGGWFDMVRSRPFRKLSATRRGLSNAGTMIIRMIDSALPQINDLTALPKPSIYPQVVCPHYLAEVVIYLGLFLASGAQNLTVLTMWVWVLLNLGVTARKNREWYLAKFEDFPRQRAAMIPGVW
jgi:hypothetical protein